jgi:hypothetical protein
LFGVGGRGLNRQAVNNAIADQTPITSAERGKWCC